MATVTFSLNGKAITTDSSKTILQAARDNGVEIPTLCYDPRLPPYGSCLVCVVEVRNLGRLLMSCATPVADDMDVWTESPMAISARKAALELLLSNHYADCRGPCFLQCPANVDIQGYLAFANAGLYKEALELIRETNPMPLSCGRVCVRYCEANCRRKDVDSPAAINFMKRYVTDLEYERLPAPVPVPTTGKKVAIIGGGPAGLTCGYFLRQQGCEVTIFDQQPKLGGMLRYGIPEYRLPQAVLDKEVDYLLAHGITARCETRLGRDFTLDGLRQDGYDVIYLALGSWVAKAMGIENERHPNILPGIVFLEGVKRDGPPRMQGTTLIVGGGNTAIDAARTALRCGSEKVVLLYRRTRAEMPADNVEVEDALEEGVEFEFLVAPKRAVIEDGKLLGLECFRMALGEPDASGRRRPVEVPDSAFLMQADWIVSAIGQDQDLAGLDNATLGTIKRTKWNSIEADPETFQTSVPCVFAGGDVMTGPAAAIDAIAAGRKAAWVIHRWLETGAAEKFQTGFVSKKTSLSPIDPAFFERIEHAERASMSKIDLHERKAGWEEVDTGISEDQIKRETSRCLSCGCNAVFDCDLKVISANYAAVQERFKGKLKKQDVDARHPFIVLDGNKCILCGRCVRYCGDLIGVNALGFVSRGFETVVKPMLDKPLQETPCISCGNCIEVCPTGAITFKVDLDQPGPFRTVAHRSVCAFCGMGCEVDVNHAGRSYFFVTAKPQDAHTEGELCAKGRFGMHYLGSPDRLFTCDVKGVGAVGMEAATDALTCGLKRFSGEELLFLASPRISCETAHGFATLARQAGSRFVFAAEDLLRPKLPRIDSTVRLDDLQDADVIVTVGEHVCGLGDVLGFKLRLAVRNGAQLLHIGPAQKAWKTLATSHLTCPEGDEALTLAALCSSILRLKHADLAHISNVEAFATRSFPQHGKDVARLTELLAAARKVVVVVNQDACLGEAPEITWASDLAQLAGASGGLLVVQNDGNGVGFRNVVYGGGFTADADLARAQNRLRQGSIKGVVTCGADLSALTGFAEHLEKVEFTAVIDLFKTSASSRADVVLPLCPIQEEDGTLVAFDGRVIPFQKVFKPLAGFTNAEWLARCFAAYLP